MQRGMMAHGDYSNKSIGERLRITREALGMNQANFCRAAKLGTSAYNQVERGRTRPSVDAAIALAKAHNLTLDWIYMGDNSGLRKSLADLIKDIRQERNRRE